MSWFTLKLAAARSKPTEGRNSKLLAAPL